MTDVITIENIKKTIFGPGTVAQLGEVCNSMSISRALLVMDHSLSKTDLRLRIEQLATDKGIQPVLFPEVSPEPSPAFADNGAELAKKEKVDAVIAVGGGSTMDVGKAIAVLVTNDGKAEDYIGLGLVQRPGLPTIMVPTTAGTGSEVTFTSVFTMRETKTKGGINSPYLYPHTAILDAELTLGLKPEVTAYTGMDALTHAIESYTSSQSHFVSEPVSLRAIEIIAENLEGAVRTGDDIRIRDNMMKGSYLAGLGLAMAGVGAVHALAYPLGAFYDIPHGIANAVMLPFVLEYNFSGDIQKFEKIAKAMGVAADGASGHDSAAQAVNAVFGLSGRIGIPASLKSLNIPQDSIGRMAEAAMKVERPIMNNPRPMTIQAAEDIYRKAFQGKVTL
ncbi:iron-containing alcohol dehydrogenase [Thermodesulfobacteriota bacterium]